MTADTTNTGARRSDEELRALVERAAPELAEASAEAVRALAAIGDAKAVSTLVEAVENRHGFFLPVVRRAAVLALVKLGGPEAAAAVSAVACGQGWAQVVLGLLPLPS